MSVNVAIIYYSSTGTVHALARAAAGGAEKAGAEVRLRRVAETAPPEAVGARPEWERHLQETAHITEAAHGDLEWADAVLFGTPTRFGNPASQLRAFIDTTGPLWFRGVLADKVYSAFTSSNTPHGGQESTLLALGNTFHHWGGIIVPPGYTDPVRFRSGNPYGTSCTAGEGAPDGGGPPPGPPRHPHGRPPQGGPRGGGLTPAGAPTAGRAFEVSALARPRTPAGARSPARRPPRRARGR